MDAAHATGDWDDLSTTQVAATRTALLAARGLGGVLLAVGGHPHGSIDERDSHPPPFSARSSSSASDFGSSSSSSSSSSQMDDYESSSSSTDDDESSSDGSRPRPAPINPIMLVAFDAASAPALALYIRTELAAALARANALHAHFVAASRRAALASVPRDSGGRPDVELLDALTPVCVREVGMSMERIQIHNSTAAAAGGEGGRRRPSNAAAAADREDAAAIAALLQSLNLDDSYSCVPPALRPMKTASAAAGDDDKTAAAAAMRAAAGGASVVPVMRHRVVLGCTERTAGDDEAAVARAARALDQTVEFATAGLSLMACWQPLAALPAEAARAASA